MATRPPPFLQCPFLSRLSEVPWKQLAHFRRFCPVAAARPPLSAFSQSSANHAGPALRTQTLASPRAGGVAVAGKIASVRESPSTLTEENALLQRLLGSEGDGPSALGRGEELSDKFYARETERRIAELHEEGRYRIFRNLQREVGRFPRAHLRDAQGKLRGEVVLWCSNDYLAMGQHPAVREAAKKAIDASGVGSGGTRNISGSNVFHWELERELADWHDKDAALLFTSGFVANEAALSTLAKIFPGLIFFSDEKNHASMIAGIRQSGAAKRIYRHNNVLHLRELLEAAPPDAPKVIVFESIYSMDGSIAPIKELCDLADEFRCLTYVDEVHAVGMYGHSGAGVAQHLGQSGRISLINGTLAKAVGVFGGYVAGDKNMVDCLRSYAGGFIFTSSLPPPVTAAAAASIRHLKKSNVERYLQQLRASELKKLMLERDLPLLFNTSHILPLLVGDARKCKEVCDLLLEKYKVYIQPINYPTVPRGTERLRITPSPMHSREDCLRLVDALDESWSLLRLPRAPEFLSRGVGLNRSGLRVEWLLHLLQLQQQFVFSKQQGGTAGGECPFALGVRAAWKETHEGGPNASPPGALPSFFKFNQVATKAFSDCHPTWKAELGEDGQLQQLLQRQLVCTQFFFSEGGALRHPPPAAPQNQQTSQTPQQHRQLQRPC